MSTPRSLQVAADSDSTPHRIHHHGRWRTVVQARERYRTDDRWWTDAPISREYFDLMLEDGRPITIYLDRLEGQWHAH